MTQETRVWAPLASKVELILPGRDLPMVRGDDGWWRAPPGAVAPGDDYLFRVDGSEPLADPRSAWQPQGVFGPSRRVDHGAFAWSDHGWQAKPLSAAIIYEAHIGTFTPQGTFDAAIGRLDQLVELGVTHLELLPVAAFLGEHGWGYDGVFPFAPHEPYGGPDGLKRLVNACHQRGLAVILDVVYNHLGPAGNCLPRFGPYFTDRYATPWGRAINFDGQYSDEARRYFCDNAKMWLRDYHLDGLRLDAVHAIVDASATTILEQLAIETHELSHALGRHLVLIAESNLNDPRLTRSREAGGYGLNAEWSDDFHHALHAVLTGERAGYYADFGSLADLAAAFKSPYVYAGRYSAFRKRRHGRSPLGLPADNFVVFLQNHDQVGNRARGDRMSHLVSHERAKIGAALMLLSPYVPLLFQGEEWGASAPFQYFVDFGAEPALAKAVAQGRRREFTDFGWKRSDVPDPTLRETFERSKLNWEEREQGSHAEMLAWYRALIALRAQLFDSTLAGSDEVHVAFDEDQGWLRVDLGAVTLACNFSGAEQAIPLPGGSGCRVLLASKGTPVVERGSVLAQGESMVVVERGDGRSTLRLSTGG